MPSSSSVRSSSQPAASSSSVAQGPFIDARTTAPINIPARIESEDYSRASDNDANNTGPCTSATGPVDYYPKQAGQLGNCDIGNTEPGEWLEYRVNSTKAARYNLGLSFATGNAGVRSAEVFLNGVALGSITIAQNGATNFSDSWLNNLALPQGQSTLKIVMTTGGVRFDAITFDAVPVSVNGEVTGKTQPVAIPARIESEDYSRAYDKDETNNGDCGNPGPVDLVLAQVDDEGLCDIAYTQPDEWAEYKITAANAGEYDLAFSFATANTGTREAEILLNNQSLGRLSVPRNGDSTFNWLPINKVQLPKGESIIKVIFTTGGVRFNALEVSQPNNNAPAITGFTLINTNTNKAIAGYENIAIGATIDVPLDELPTRNIVLKANTAGDVKSVQFGLNARTKYYLDPLAPFAIYPDKNGTFRKWTLFAGSHNISATPFSTKDASSGAGGIAAIKINLLETRWSITDASLDFIAKLNTNTSNTLSLKNIGNMAGRFTLTGLPNWLQANKTSGQINAAATENITLTSTNCTQVGTQEATINITGPGSNITPITVRQACTNGTLFDIALDRFYINQAVPAVDSAVNTDNQIPTIKNRTGLARAFVTATSTSNQIPTVRLFYKKANGQTGNYALTGPTSLLTTADESKINGTFNNILPKSFFELGTQYYVEVDPDNQIPEANKNNNRYPKSGYATLSMQDVPTLKIVFVPVIIEGEDPNLTDDLINTLMQETLKLHPIENYTFSIRAPYTYTGTKWGDALSKIAELRKMDNSTQYYHGLVNKRIEASGTSGIGYIASYAALSRKDAGTIAHEFGHNFSLNHTDCGGPASPDNNYPYADATTNIWGYNILTNVLTPPTTKDFMSYCANDWVSQYSYNKVLNYRGQEGSGTRKTQIASTPETVYWLSGKITPNANATQITLMNVFTGQSDAEPSSGDYTLTAYNNDGIAVYYTRFNATPVDHSNEAHFLVALPQEDISRLEIWHNNALLYADTWASNAATTAQQKTRLAPPPIATAKRLDAERVKIQWAPTKLSSLTIKDDATVLTNDQTGHAIVFTTSHTLTATLTAPGVSTTQTITVEE